MAIIIPSKNIYEINNPKIRDNVIDNVNVHQTVITPNNEYETPVFQQDLITENYYPVANMPKTNITFVDDINSYNPLVGVAVKIYNYYCPIDIIINKQIETSIIKKLYTGFKSDETTSYTQISRTYEENVWNYQVNNAYLDSSRNFDFDAVVNYSGDKTFFKNEVYRGLKNFSVYFTSYDENMEDKDRHFLTGWDIKVNHIEEEVNSVDVDAVVYTVMGGYAPNASVESIFKSIEDLGNLTVEEHDNYFKISIDNIFVGRKIYVCGTGIYRANSNSSVYPAKVIEIEQKAIKTEITFFGDTIGIDLTDGSVTYGSGNKPFLLSNNELMQYKETINYANVKGFNHNGDGLTINGYTNNTLVVNGTCIDPTPTIDRYFVNLGIVNLPKGRYILKGMPKAVGLSALYLNDRENGAKIAESFYDPIEFSLEKEKSLNFYFVASNGDTFNNFIIAPEITNINNSEYLAKNILTQYAKGKETATLLCSISDYYDELGYNIITINNPINNLPNEYQQVPYIESTGTQYINTEYTPNQDTRVEMNFQITENTNGYLFGARQTTATSLSNAYTFSTHNYLFHYAYNGTGDINIKVNSDLHRHSLFTRKLYIDLDGKTIYSNDQTFTFTCPTSMDLFAYATTEQHGNSPCKMRLYSCKLYDETIKVREFIPCYRKSDKKAGLYDLVEGKFYPNSTTTGNDFVIGETKMSFRLHDQVIPMVFGANGQDQPMSRYQDGSPKVFEVVGSNIIYDGAVWQEITLQELLNIT